MPPTSYGVIIMSLTDNYLDYLEEDFTFVNKVFKAKLLKGIAKKIKGSVRGNKINISALKSALKPIPVITQDNINRFLDKYVPNYTTNYNITKKYFDKKYPTEKNTDTMSGVTVLIAAVDKKRTLKDQIKRTERLYSSSLGTSGAGGSFVIFLIGLALTMTIFSVPELFDGGNKMILAAGIGIFLMISAVLSLFN